jgi:hypothetical protein
MRTAVMTLAAMSIALASSAMGGPVTIPSTFTPGTPAKASDVNANFSAVAKAVNGSANDIANLQTAVKNTPAGPQGPVGPQGPQGPTGTGALVVKDSTGKLVGSYLPNATVASPSQNESVFIRTPTVSFAVSFDTSQLGLPNYSSLFFVSADCTGTPYIFTPGPAYYGPTAITNAVVVNTTVYILGSPRSSLTLNSSQSPSGGSLVCSLGVHTDNFTPVVSSFDISTLGFVPPFSVQ